MFTRSASASIRITAIILAVSLSVIGFFIFRKSQKAPLPVRLPAERKAVRKAPSARIAIVIDDVGNNAHVLEALGGLKYPLTFAILPDAPLAGEVAAMLHEHGYETMLHMPMEPREPQPLEPSTIMDSMDDDQIRDIVRADIERFPFIVGMNNHMGSRITATPRALAVVFQELRRQRLFFLDSYVTAESVAASVASREKVRFLKRDVFLDNDSDSAAIRKQIERLKARARQNGYAVAIGHDRKATLAVLREQLPVLVRQGYRLVFASSLAQ